MDPNEIHPDRIIENPPKQTEIEHKAKSDIERDKHTKIARFENEARMEKQESNVKIHVSSLVATLGKISGVIKRTRATVKYKNISSLTSKQKRIINDLASDLTETGESSNLKIAKMVRNLMIFFSRYHKLACLPNPQQIIESVED